MQITTFALFKQLSVNLTSLPLAISDIGYKNNVLNRNQTIAKEKQWLSFEKRRRRRETSDKDRMIAYTDRLNAEND